MSRGGRSKSSFLAIVLVLLGGAGTVVGKAGAAPGRHVHHGPNGETDVTVCADADAGRAQCFAHERTDDVARSNRPARPGGRVTAAASTLGNSGAYDPAFLQSAYNAPSATAGTGRTVAIVDAYDDPNAYADMTSYRSFFRLPACSIESGCFRKVDQRGGTAYPRPDASWAGEIALDLDMVSAICPNCNIVLVEANSNYLSDLATAANTAVTVSHADAVSNSYGAGEWSGQSSLSTGAYNHPGVAVTAASGDSGYGLWFPASSRNVVGVGGTTLTQNSATGVRDATETAWRGAGSGCSAYEAKPSWQHDTGCTKRSVTDVSAVADPATGVWVYDTYGSTGWRILGGTSVASPIVGALYAMAGAQSTTDNLASYPYGDAQTLNDVTSGSNGTCAVVYLCTAVAGYDGPTGVGTPSGTAPFVRPATVVPDAPANASATAGNARATASWTPPPFDGWGSVTAYTVTSAPGGVSATVAGTQTSGAVAGLTNGVSYTFTVRAVNEAGGGPPSAPSNAVVPGSWSRVDDGGAGVTYRGTWTRVSSSFYYGGGYRWSSAAASAAVFTFTGTGVRWFGVLAPTAGIAEVRLDGVLVATIDAYSATIKRQIAVFERTGLASRQHTIDVRVTGRRNARASAANVYVDAFDRFS